MSATTLEAPTIEERLAGASSLRISADDLEAMCLDRGLLFRRETLEQIAAALDLGKHLVLTGPPGTGKTTLAHLVAELAQRTLVSGGHVAVTASAEWTAEDTIGRHLPSPEGLLFHPGVFVEAVESGRWLVVDELNRCDLDRAFGPLFTVLSGQVVELPHKRWGRSQRMALVPPGLQPPPATDAIQVPRSWRIVATMNDVDRGLFDLSYALMRRFAFIEVTAPDDQATADLLGDQWPLLRPLAELRGLRDFGPAILLDAAEYSRRRRADGASDSRVLYEVVFAYVLPQFRGQPSSVVESMRDALVDVLDESERAAFLDAVRRVLADELTPAA